MMRSTGKILLAAAATLFLALASGCTNQVADTLGAPNWGLVGSWVFDGYAPTGAPTPTNCHVFTILADGNLTATGGIYTPTTGNYRIDSVSTGTNTRQYQVAFTYSTPPFIYTVYCLVRVTDGSTCELCAYNPTTNSYPPAMTSGMGYSYIKYTRQ